MVGARVRRDPLSAEDQLVGEYLDEWLERRSTQLRPTSLRGYRNAIRRYLTPRIGAVSLQALDRRTIERLYAQLLVSGGRDGRSLSPRTVSFVHAILHGALEDAVLDDLLEVNPASHARRPTRDPNETEVDEDLHIWTLEQAAHFLDEVDDHPWRAVWHLAVGTGARRGEVLGLRWLDVDLEEGAVRIRRSLSVMGGVPRLLGTKTSRNRTVAIGASVVEALGRERDEQAARRRAAGEEWCNEWGLVFTDDQGAPVNPMNVTLEFRRLVRELAVPVIRLHDLRHTHASLLLHQEAQMKLVSDRLGHARIATTMDIYAHLLPAVDSDAADQLDASLRQARDDMEE